MTTNYKWVTNEMFEDKLNQIVSRMSTSELMAIDDIGSILHEELNNEVLAELEAERPPMTSEEYGKSTKGTMPCPICRDTDIVYDDLDIAVGFIYRPAKCSSCDSTWTAVYRVTGYVDLEEG